MSLTILAQLHLNFSSTFIMDCKKFENVEGEFDEEEIKQFSLAPEPVQDDIIKRIDEINNMNEKDLVAKLKCFHLNSQGSTEVLRNRLKNSYKKISLATVNWSVCKTLLPYYVVIDFEATCDEPNSQDYNHEIIEFAAVIVDTKKQEITDCFQMFCKPTINPVLTEFCTELTGITQEIVNSAEYFENVFDCFERWLAKHKLGQKYKFAVVSDGPWDMSRFLYSQCYYSNIKFPKWGSKWVNLKKPFAKFYKCERFCLRNMLKFLDMDFEGRPHCGLDDAKNIARILLRMIYDGADIQANERITGGKKEIGKIKRHTEKIEVVNDNQENKNYLGDEKIEKKRVEAHFAVIYHGNRMVLYKEIRRNRAIMEAHLARKLFKNSNKSEDKLENNNKLRTLNI